MLHFILKKNFSGPMRRLGIALLTLTLTGMLLAHPGAAPPAAAQAAQSTLPQKVRQSLVFLNLNRDIRHVRLILECLQGEISGLSQLVRSRKVLRTLGLKRLKAGAKGQRGKIYVADVNGQPHAISKRVADDLVLSLTRYLIAHPKFRALFDRYISKLKFHERVGIRAVMIARSRVDLLRKDGRKIIIDKLRAKTKRALD